MELGLWLKSFKVLHDVARKGELAGEEREKYVRYREELARALVAAQRLVVPPGKTARQALRVARALPLDLDLPEGRQRFMTMHLSSGGFGALLAKSMSLGTEVGFSLKRPGQTEPLVGRARVVDVQQRGGNPLVSFAFDGLTPETQEKIELVLFDAVLQQFEGLAF